MGTASEQYPHQTVPKATDTIIDLTASASPPEQSASLVGFPYIEFVYGGDQVKLAQHTAMGIAKSTRDIKNTLRGLGNTTTLGQPSIEFLLDAIASMTAPEPAAGYTELIWGLAGKTVETPEEQRFFWVQAANELHLISWLGEDRADEREEKIMNLSFALSGARVLAERYLNDVIDCGNFRYQNGSGDQFDEALLRDFLDPTFILPIFDAKARGKKSEPTGLSQQTLGHCLLEARHLGLTEFEHLPMQQL